MEAIEGLLPHCRRRKHGLSKLHGWRAEKELYFREYLSQGRLNLEGYCLEISLKELSDLKLLGTFCPSLEKWPDNWAKAVKSMRMEMAAEALAVLEESDSSEGLEATMMRRSNLGQALLQAIIVKKKSRSIGWSVGLACGRPASDTAISEPRGC